ncbi:MAG: FHA domain-containing protein [Myxococcota bacterium]
MSEPNRKTLRSFYCRDYLWDLFEVMTRDLGCSMDYLINEAMRHYARSRNYSLSGAGVSQGGVPMPLPPGAAPGYAQQPTHPQQGYDHPTYSQMSAVRMAGAQPQPQPQRPYAAQPPQAPAPVMPSAYAQPSSLRFAPPPPPPPRASAPPPPAPQAPSAYAPPAPPQAKAPPPPPPPTPRSAPPPPPTEPARPSLALVFNNQRYPVNKDKFIIGRGSTMTDLTIRDGNISRKHAAVIFRNGQWYIKDLDSTNGIDYQGNRIDSKRIEEGDIFHICDYEIRFTYS